ncbi:MAG: alkaline phosphatase family protein [Armatimonadota bacterium]|nr:alkaline phosphatase family protein [Armatimonadota bacterium]
MAKAKKVIVLGFDGATVEFVQHYMKQGRLPNYRKLMKMGSFMRNCLCPYPTITPPNWTTIATGARIGTHGVTCFWQHHPGDPLDKFRTGFDSRDNRAEYFWAAAGRAGKRSIVFNFPSTWPPVKFPGIQVDGSDLTVGNRAMLRRYVIYSSPAVAAPTREVDGWLYQPDQSDELAQLKPAAGWRNIKLRPDALEMELEFKDDGPKSYVGHPDFPDRAFIAPVNRYLLIDKSRGKNYDRVRLFSDKDGRKLLGESTSRKVWSDWIQDRFELTDGDEKVWYKIRILSLDPGGKFVRTLVTSLMVPKGWSRPATLGQELLREVGPHFPATAWIFREDETGLEIESEMHDWYGRAINYLAEKDPWDAIFMHAHVIDFANHWWIDRVEPESIDWPGNDKYDKLLRKAYEITDRLLGQVMELADEDTLFVLVSDHGSTTRSQQIPPFGNPHRTSGKILEDAGLLVYDDGDPTGARKIDWSKTKAACQRAGYVYVNLKGRDPDGIVEPGEEYEKVRTQVINLFYDYTDPATGKKPITLAIRNEHAALLGLYGDRIGDIVYALEPEFEHAHGQELPTAKFGRGSQTSLLIMAGPGIRKNHTVARPTALTDIVPTICHLTGFPVPKECEGGVIYQALEEAP